MAHNVHVQLARDGAGLGVVVAWGELVLEGCEAKLVIGVTKTFQCRTNNNTDKLNNNNTHTHTHSHNAVQVNKSCMYGNCLLQFTTFRAAQDKCLSLKILHRSIATSEQ